MNQSQFSKLIAGLNLVVFERIQDTHFMPNFPLPNWALEVFPHLPHTQTVFDLATLDPFVENFLIDAKAFWNNTQNTHLASGIWTQTDTHRNEIHLEIFAMQPDGCDVIVFKQTEKADDKFATLLQRGREKSLQFEYDLQREKELRQENQRLAELAETSNRLKSEFLANMSHEIRTPMNGIIGMTELVLETPLTPEQRKYLALVKDSADELLMLLNDILDFSKIEAGKLHLENEYFDLHTSIEKTLRALRVRAEQKGLQLICDIQPNVPTHLRGDPWRLRQILVNLVGNAIKFTHQGKITVTVAQRSYNAGSAKLLLSVQDTGIGISQENQIHIFEAFSQADGSTRRQYEGTGLGLAISSQLVKMMGGEIWLKSTKDKGSTFFFTLVLETVEEVINTTKDTHTQPTQMEAPPTLNIILAEDNAVNQLLVKRILEKREHQVTVATTGQAVLNLLKEKPFDLILMDVQMPEMDGYQATMQIRKKEEKKGGHIPIIAMTAHTMQEDKLRCLEVGMDAYLAKPISAEELIETVETITAGNEWAQKKMPVEPIEAALDKDALLMGLENDLDLLAFMVSLFWRDWPEFQKNIKEAITQNDPKKLEPLAHKLQGAVGNFGEGPAYMRSQRLTRMARQGKLVEPETEFSMLEMEVKRLKTALDDILQKST